MGRPQSAIQDTIDSLEADAAAHKRIAAQNREQASKKLALREQLIAFCHANQIPVVRERGSRDG